MVPLLIMATSLVSKINTRVALLKGWVNSFLAFMGQLYIGFYRWTSNSTENMVCLLLGMVWEANRNAALLSANRAAVSRQLGSRCKYRRRRALRSGICLAPRH